MRQELGRETVQSSEWALAWRWEVGYWQSGVEFHPAHCQMHQYWLTVWMRSPLTLPLLLSKRSMQCETPLSGLLSSQSSREIAGQLALLPPPLVPYLLYHSYDLKQVPAVHEARTTLCWVASPPTLELVALAHPI